MRGQQGDKPDDAGLVARIAGGEHGGEEGVGEKSGHHDDDEAEQPQACRLYPLSRHHAP